MTAAGRGIARRWRTATGASLLGLRRRAGADAWPLTLMAALLLLAVVLADATPRLLTRVGDEAVRAAVAAHPTAGLTVTTPFDDGFVSADRDPTTAERVAADGATIEAALPPALARVLDPPSGLVSTTYLPTATPDGAVSLQMAYLWRDGFAGVEWVEGHAPGLPATGEFGRLDSGPWPVAVGLSAPVAAQLGAHPGDRLAASGPDGNALDVTVSGIFRAREPADPLWAQVPGLLEPITLGANAGERTVVGALLSSESVADIRLALAPQAVTRTFTLRVRPGAMTFADLGDVSRAAAALEAAPKTLGLSGPRPAVWTVLEWLAQSIQARVRAAGAQASVLLVGTLGASASVLVLAAWLLVRRRAVVLRRHRARGASLPAVGLGLAVEQAALCLVVGAAALALAQRLAPGPISWPWVLPLLAVATLAVPVFGTATAAGPAARRASSEETRRRALQPSQVRRAALETALLLTSVAALVTLRRRGLPEAPGGADLLLAAAPALAALAIGVAGARGVLVLFRTAVPVAARLRRAGPLLASAGAAAVPALGPFVALTMCTTLAVFSTVIGATVTAGQVAGSWDTVGADVVAHTDADHPLDAVADSVRRAPGVAEVAVGRLVPSVQVAGVPGTDWVDVLAVDAHDYARLTAAAPLPAVPGLSALIPAPADDAALPVLGDASLGADGAAPALLWNGRAALPLRRVGAAPALSPALAGTAPTAGLVVVDRRMLAAATGEPLDADVLWAVGPGAEQALEGAGLDPAAVTGRTAWLSERRNEPLTSGLLLLLRVAAPILVGLGLAVVALAAAVDATRRAGTLAVLRVLGLNRRQVGRVAVGELVPWVLLATAGGVAAGVWLAALALGPFQLRLVTGQDADPALVWPWWLLGLPLLVVLVAGAVAAVQAQRRSALGQVMRIGA